MRQANCDGISSVLQPHNINAGHSDIEVEQSPPLYFYPQLLMQVKHKVQKAVYWKQVMETGANKKSIQYVVPLLLKSQNFRDKYLQHYQYKCCHHEGSKLDFANCIKLSLIK